MTTGGVRCWGNNMYGQLGDGTTTSRPTPPPTDVLTGVQAIATGFNHTCALMTTGGVRCWGYNRLGELGDGTTTSRATPPPTDVLTGVQAIAAGGGHTCALVTTGGVRCWGSNSHGQLGDGTWASRSTPPTTDVLTEVQAIATGVSHACALMTTGGVRCWGANTVVQSIEGWQTIVTGQLGDGTTTDRSTPPTTDALSGARAIAAGRYHPCALTTTGGVRCWGDNSSGQIGAGSHSNPTPVLGICQ
jgi:alpha-tubulin suppressor-like RCC1 family protein